MTLCVLDVVPEPVSTQEQDFIDLLLGDPNQQHPSLTQNEILMRVAQRRANDMVNRNYWSHTDPDGWGPNHHVREAGYDLDSSYGTNPTDNQVELISANSTSALTIWNAFMASQPHEEALLGLTAFYEAQDEFGVGYAQKTSATPYDKVWVVILAKQN